MDLNWTKIEAATEILNCRPPYSFYFDLIDKRWRAPRNASNPTPLHRICTLARKMGAHQVVFENALEQLEVCEEISNLDKVFGGGGSAEAVAISFFAENITIDTITSTKDAALIGQAILINYYSSPSQQQSIESYVYESFIRPPSVQSPNAETSKTGLLNNFICADRTYKVKVLGCEFEIPAIYYAQQNSLTSVCAHACLRMALNTIQPQAAFITNAHINSDLDVCPPLKGGLSLDAIEKIIKSKGLGIAITDCDNIDYANYLSILTSIVESGCIALLVFTTNSSTDHVVTVFGHTRNSDEWHPQAIPAYSGPRSAHYYPSSSWADHFLIHDDNFGPYYALGSRALDKNPSIRPRHIIALYPTRVEVLPSYAEGLAASVLNNALPNFAPHAKNQWLKFIATQEPTQLDTKVLRTIFISRDKYLAHLGTEVGHDGSRMTPTEVAAFAYLPDSFWMVEFSLPYLYTGNRSKLGEVLIRLDHNLTNLQDIVLGIRLPSSMFIREQAGEFALHLTSHLTSLHSHSPIFRYRHHDYEW